MLPVSTAIGAILLMSADAVCRYLSGERFLASLLPVGVLTGLLGGPFFSLVVVSGEGEGVGIANCRVPNAECGEPALLLLFGDSIERNGRPFPSGRCHLDLGAKSEND